MTDCFSFPRAATRSSSQSTPSSETEMGSRPCGWFIDSPDKKPIFVAVTAANTTVSDIWPHHWNNFEDSCSPGGGMNHQVFGTSMSHVSIGQIPDSWLLTGFQQRGGSSFVSGFLDKGVTFEVVNRTTILIWVNCDGALAVMQITGTEALTRSWTAVAAARFLCLSDMRYLLILMKQSLENSLKRISERTLRRTTRETLL